MRRSRFFRLIQRRFVFVLLFILTLAGCRIFTQSPVSEPIPMITSLPRPELPDWITEINPIGDTSSLGQIRVIFKDPLIPVENLDSSNQKNLLEKFELTPKIPGQFRFLTPKMVGFQADQALPLSTRLQVTLKQGLEDLNNHQLEQDIAWTFETEPIKLSNLPGSKETPGSPENPLGLNPTLKFNSNVELDLASLQQHLQLISPKTNQAVPVNVKLTPKEINQNPPIPLTEFNPANQTWEYEVTPTVPLEAGTKYTFKINPGLRPAQGNLETQVEIKSSIKTYDSLKFQSLEFPGKTSPEGTFGRFVTGNPQLKFNNIIVAQSALENITLTPAPKPEPKLIQAYDNNTISLNPGALEPQTNYTVKINSNLKDQFGQTLGKPVTVQFKTGDLTPELWVPSGLNIFPTNQNLQLNISTLNLPESQYRANYNIVQPTDLVYADQPYPREEGKNLLLPPEKWTNFRVETAKNQVKETSVNLREKLNGNTGLLAYGVTAKTTRYQQEGQEKWQEPQYFGLVQLTNLGVFAQWFPESGLVRVHHLDDGSPAANVTVEIYESKLEAKSFPQPKPCATGTTDNKGVLALNSEQLQQCMNGGKFKKAPELLVIAKEGKDWAFTRTFGYSGAYGYGISANWEDQEILARGVIFSDRQLYKSGEKVSLTGVAYYLQNGNLKPRPNSTYKVSLENPQGKKQELGEYQTNEFATFSFELPLKSEQQLGNYIVRAMDKNGVEIYGNFRVADFKPPNFKVELSLNQEFAQIGDEITANTESEYLFGSPVAEGATKYYVTRLETEFKPKGWDEYAFGRQWFWPEEKPNVSDSVLQDNQVLDTAGKGSKTFKVADDLPYPMTYRVDAEVTDISNLSVADSQSLIALPSDRLIGLKTKFVGEAGKPLPVEVIVTDIQGNPVNNVGVQLQLQKMDYSQVTRVLEGAQTDKNQVKYETVAEVNVQSNQKPQTISLTASESGSYRIRANFTNANTEITATDLQIWVTGNNSVTWGGTDENRLQVKLDKTSYKPGETATALIQSPYEEGELYFAVVRDKPLYETLTKVKGGAPEIQFKVTSEMLPNAAVEAVLVRQGKPLTEVEPGSLDKLTKIGFAPFNINLEDRNLNVQVTPSQPKLEPATQQTLQLELKDAKNQPIQGQFTVMVVNDAVLQLNDYRPPNLVEIIYAEQPIVTRFSDNRTNVVLAQTASSLNNKGWGYGGGLSSATANPRIRKNFQPLAYYNGSIVTDNQGKATVNFKVPDDLTTWRVMVVATDKNLRFGSGETTFVTTQSLLSNPILPQFARPGDRILAGLSVTNLTDERGNLNITGTVDGGIQFSAGNADQQTLKTKAKSGTEAYRFPILVTQPANAQVQFTTEFNGKSDGFEVPLEVKTYNITEQVVESGITTNPVTIPINVSKKVVPDAGGLDVNLASTLIPQLTAPAEQIFQQEQWPFLETSASQLMIAANLQALGKKYNQSFSNFQLPEQAKTAVSQIQKLQQEDGGIAAYPSQKISDPFLSAYTAEALAQAKNAGFSVDNNVVNRLKTYLNQVVVNPGKFDFCADDVCKNTLRLNALIGLDELGEQRSDFLEEVYKQQAKFDPATQLKLARYLSQFPQWKDEYNTLLKEVQKNIYVTGRTATVNLPQGYSWLNSPTTIQSQALRLFITQNNPSETVDKLTQSLLNLRKNGTWGSTYDTAQALTALVAYSQAEPTPPNFNVQVKLGDQPLGETQFKGFENSSYRLNIPMTELPKGENNLVLQPSNSGKLNYWVAYRYQLEGNQPGRLNGLRVTRIIRPVNQGEVLQTIDLNSPEKPLKVEPGQVFDIGLEIITDHPVDHVMISDPLPAGFEAIDTSLKISNQAVQSQINSWEIQNQTIYKDRVTAYSDRLEPGVYQLHYLVRSVTPGEYLWPGAEAKLQYNPEEFGRNASTLLIVSNQ